MSAEQRMQEWVVNRAAEWFAAHRAGDLNEAQREEFIDWLRASPTHLREYLALTGFSEDLKSLAKGFGASADTLIERARNEPEVIRTLFPAQQARAQEPHASATASRSRRFRGWAIAASAVLAVLVVAPFVVWRFLDHTNFSTAHAEQRSWRMPDGSTVHLNSGSKIKIRFDEHRREVDLLQGQALFQVAKDARRPFWVRAGDATVKAVGTEFDVYRQPERTVISVVEGRVAVWSAEPSGNAETLNKERATQLDAGQQARIGRQSTEVSKKAEDVRKTIAWLQRQVVFDHDSLGAAAAEFNRYTETRIRIEDEVVRSVEVSGIFSAYDSEAFIRFLESQPDLHVERTGPEVIVTPSSRP
jgi:transmembrane sensor